MSAGIEGERPAEVDVRSILTAFAVIGRFHSEDDDLDESAPSDRLLTLARDPERAAEFVRQIFS